MDCHLHVWISAFGQVKVTCLFNEESGKNSIWSNSYGEINFISCGNI